MILRKFIGWTILLGSFLLGYLAFPVGAEERSNQFALKQTSDGPARLRIENWPPAGWIVQQFDSLVEIRFPQWSQSIETPNGLTGRLRQRVAALESELRGDDLYVRLTLTCQCTVAVTADGDDAVVIDVVDPFGAGPSTARQSGPAPWSAPFPMPKPGSKLASAQSDQALDVDQARERLMEQLLRAADAGIVDLKPENAVVDVAETAVVNDTDDDSVEQPAVDPQPVAPETPAASDPQDVAPAEDVADADADPTVAEAEPENVRPAPRCYPDDAFAFPDLATSADYVGRASELNSKLIGEFDAVDKGVALELIKLQIASGLGAESLVGINEFLTDHPDAELYREISAVVEEQKPLANASVLKEDCSGLQGLWRAVAKGMYGNHADALKDAKAAAPRLEEIPRSIREFMAVQFGWSATQVGDWEFARRMDAMAARSASRSYGPSGRAVLLAARLDEWHDEKDEALRKLRQARNFPGAIGDDALLRLAEIALTRSDLAQVPTSHLNTDLEILAKKDRGGERGARAFELLVKLTDHGSGRDAAMAALDEGIADGLFPAENRAALLSEVAEGVDFEDTSRPLALVFLDDPTRFSDAMEKPGFRRAVISSMVDLGLPAMAVPILADEDRIDPGLVTKLAKAFLRADEPRDAEDLLRALPENPMRNALMARALIKRGDVEGASDYFAMADLSKTELSEHLPLLDSLIDASIASGDVDKALELGSKRLALADDEQVATRLALAALNAGQDVLPDTLSPALPNDERTRLGKLFQSDADPQAVKDVPGMKAFMETLDTEISTIEDLLKDG